MRQNATGENEDIGEIITRSDADGFEGDKTARNGLDEAIVQVERGEYEVFNTFDEFKVAMAND